MRDDYISKLVCEWGVSKTFQVVMFSFAGACLISAICIRMLPDKPTNFTLTKDKEKNDEKKYFNQYS